MHQSRVPYSINKKGRWELPNIIKSSIEDGDFDDEEFAVQIVERHKILGQSNCISIHASKNPNNLKHGKRGIHRKIGYLNANSILEPRRHHLTRRERRNRWRREVPDHEEIEEPIHVPSSVRYEVLYPPSPTSGIRYKPNYTGYDPESNWGSFYCGCRRRCNCHNKTRGYSRRKCREEIIEEFHSQYFDNDDLNDDNEDVNDSTMTEFGESSKSLLLGELLNNIIHKETQRKRKRKHSGSKTESSPATNTMSKVVVVERSTRHSDTTVQNPVKAIPLPDKNVLVDPVLVSIQNKDVSPDTLKNIYGEQYAECSCFPRKFVIDITERIRNTRTSIETDTETQEEMNACVVFCLDTDNEVSNEKESIYKVILNTNSLKNLHSYRIETLFDNMDTTVEECLERTVFFVETLPEFILTTPKLFQISKKHRVSNIEKSGNWESEAYAPTKSFCYSEYLARNKVGFPTKQVDFAGIAYTVINNKGMSILDGKLCDICYESLGAKIPGTCLISCGHWFCDGCWAEYLKSRIDAGATCLTCPEFDCDEMVDSCTVVSLVGLNDVIRHANIFHDNNVERGDDTKWCPNKNCGRVVKVNRVDVKTGKCECGQKFCFDCLRQPHWPAPCESDINYYKRLEETGDIGLAPVESTDTVIVNGKNCPHCKKFVEKDGGCPFMACVCGNSFCWGCGKDWSSNTHDKNCFRFGVKNEHDTSEIAIEDDLWKRNFKTKRWYNIAVKHRVEQHQIKVEKLKASRKALVKYLSTYIGKSARRGINVSLNFNGLKSTYRNEQEKLIEYVNELIHLHQELNSIAEHTAVLIESGKVPADSITLLQYIIRRLASFSEGISNGFLRWVEREPEDLLVTFNKIRNHSYSTIKHLFTSVNKLGL